MQRSRLALAMGLLLIVLLCRGSPPADVELLNVSSDPTRELWRDLNELFARRFEEETGKRVHTGQSHGGSGSQARAVIDGLGADVVTLALWPDIDLLRANRLVADEWEERLPYRSRPCYSTIVFVVRRGNPRGIWDWPDLVRGDVQVITPSPRTSGNGKLSLLAAWGAVRDAGGDEAQAREYLRQLYARVPVLDLAARGATVTFSRKKIGDVHLTWENEAHREVALAKGELEVVYPPASIRAEPHVAVVDRNVDRHGTREAAEAYLKRLYTREAQEVMARHHYRPIDPEVLARHRDRFPAIRLFSVTLVARDWNDAGRKFFAKGALFDQICQPNRKRGDGCKGLSHRAHR